MASTSDPAASAAASSAPSKASSVKAKAASAKAAASGAASSARNVASSSTKSEAATKVAGEALSRSKNAKAQAAGKLLAGDGGIKEKAQQAAALGAGAAVGAGLTAVGAGAAAGVASDVATRFVGSKNLKRNLAIMALLLSLPAMLGIFNVIMASVLLTSMFSVSQEDECQPSTISAGTGTVVGNSVDEKVWNYMIGAGYTPEQTAGVMGNVWQESKFNPFLTEGLSSTPNTSRGWGLVQWTADRHLKIRDAVIADPSLGQRFYIAAPGYETMPASMTQDDIDALVLFQMRYIIMELQTNEKAAGADLKTQTTVEGATRSFMNKYERPHKDYANEAGRLENARKYMALYGPGGTGATTPAATTPTTPAAPAAPAPVYTPGGGSAVVPPAADGSTVVAAIPAVAGFSAEQVRTAATILATARALGYPDEAGILAITTAIGESTLGADKSSMDQINGDGDTGLYQMRVIERDGAYYGTEAQVRDPVWSTTAWLNGVTTHAGTMKSLSSYPNWKSMDPVDLIHKIQGNTAETNFVYTNNLAKARELVAAMSGLDLSSIIAGTATIPAGGAASACGGSSIPGTIAAGSVTPCPDGSPAGCVNFAALTAPSASLICPAGTSDAGVHSAYIEGNPVQVRICSMDGVTDTSGRPIKMNATIASQFLSFYAEGKAMGLEMSINSTWRTHQEQVVLAARTGNAAPPGWSNHEFGMAFDMGGFQPSYERGNCGATQTPENSCYYPGSGPGLQRWIQLRDLGLKHGMYIHNGEFWHIEFIPSNAAKRGIPEYRG
ncbi:phage tail tip lysozyme [Brachybacterium sp. JHP9]|uniref:Phage tail tip lysozyme n=1 Tax=Brachybacterium equifaecis TaxID=2910770 RepID=A0ABT0R337_9MICO|nr:phage tail tip lysozyme [Brachybacterium equifaecis]MCL6424350.1 phage tail tip lysozyme [Brachybacterium equifaecis]